MTTLDGDQPQWPKKRHVKSNSFSMSESKNKIPPDEPTGTASTNTDTGEPDPVDDVDDEVDGAKAALDGGNGGGSCRCYIPKRVIVTVLLGAGMLLVYAMRTNVGVMVVMILDERAFEKLESEDAILNVPKVDWDARHVGFLHSVFYIGFIITQIPAAFCTTIWPSHRLYGGCILVSALLNMLLPVCIENGVYGLTCVIRGCQGLAEGWLYPACYGVLRHWTAPSERSRQVSAVLSCCYAGAIVGFPMAGFLSHYLRWQYIFYASGCLCVLWWVVWACLAYEKPSHHAHISDTEFDFMTKAQGQDVIDYENLTVPWGAIVTSLPVIAICLCHFVRHWVLGLMLTNEPLYLSQFGFNIAQAGALASIPHIAKMIMSFVSGYIADILLNYKTMSTTLIRKIFVGVGFGLQTAGFLILTLLVDGTAVIIVLTIAVGVFGLTTAGWSVNHYDLSTRYASSLVAVTSTFGSLGAIAVPIAAGHLTVQQDLEGWQHVFYLTAGIIVLATVFFLIFGSGEQQSWSEPPAHLCLVQKTDPLARKPYTAHVLQDIPLHKDTYVPPSQHTAVVSTQSVDGDEGQHQAGVDDIVPKTCECLHDNRIQETVNDCDAAHETEHNELAEQKDVMDERGAKSSCVRTETRKARNNSSSGDYGVADATGTDRYIAALALQTETVIPNQCIEDSSNYMQEYRAGLSNLRLQQSSTAITNTSSLCHEKLNIQDHS